MDLLEKEPYIVVPGMNDALPVGSPTMRVRGHMPEAEARWRSFFSVRVVRTGGHR